MWKQLIITVIVCATMGYCASTTVSLEHNWGYELTKLVLKRDVSWEQGLTALMMQNLAIPLFAIGLYFGYARIHCNAPAWWRLFATAPFILQTTAYWATVFFVLPFINNEVSTDFASELATVLQTAKEFIGRILTDPELLFPILLAAVIGLIPLYGALFVGEVLYKNLALRTIPLKLIMPATQVMILLTVLSLAYDGHNNWILAMALDFTAIAAVAALATYNCRMTEYSRALSASFFATLPLTIFNLFNLAYDTSLFCNSNMQGDSGSAIVSASLITCAAAAATLIGAKVGTIIVSAKNTKPDC